MDEQDKITIRNKIIIRTYTGSQAEATALYQADSASMAAQDYFPTTQSWAPGQWSGGAFLVALILCIVIIGFFVFVYMLIAKPAGTLSVTYELREILGKEKTCPKCGEKIKAVAVVCRYCGYNFPYAQAESTEPVIVSLSKVPPPISKHIDSITIKSQEREVANKLSNSSSNAFFEDGARMAGKMFAKLCRSIRKLKSWLLTFLRPVNSDSKVPDSLMESPGIKSNAGDTIKKFNLWAWIVGILAVLIIVIISRPPNENALFDAQLQENYDQCLVEHISAEPEQGHSDYKSFAAHFNKECEPEMNAYLNSISKCKEKTDSCSDSASIEPMLVIPKVFPGLPKIYGDCRWAIGFDMNTVDSCSLHAAYSTAESLGLVHHSPPNPQVSVPQNTQLNEQKFWDKPTRLQGTFHRGQFTNCCIEGKESEGSYNDLYLTDAIDISGATNDPDEKMQNVEHVQIDAPNAMIIKIKDGDKITVECSSLSLGNTGHYALPVYCDASSIEVTQQEVSTFANQPQGPQQITHALEQ